MEKPEQKENPTRNLLTDYDNTVEAMVQVEGEAWRKVEESIEKQMESETDKSEIDYISRNSLPGAMRQLRSGHLTDEEGLDLFRYVIYGAHGMTRWIVNGDGTVIFSKSHGTPKSEQKARELGFEIE